jgi:hypothetical protein
VVGGAGVCHPVYHGHRGSGHHRAEAAGEGLGIPLPKPRCPGQRLLWQRQREQGSHLLHRKAILECRKEGVWRRPVRGSAHGRLEGGWLGRSASAGPHDGAHLLHRKPYWGAIKKACSINQYGAPPMDELKNGQTGAPAAVLARMLTVAVATKGSAAPAAATMAPMTRSREAAAAA